MKTAKKKLCALTSAILLSVIPPSAIVFGQTSATSDPVGLVDLSVSGGTLAAPKLSLVSPTLTQPVLWQGAITGISGTTITVSGTPWTPNQFNVATGSHYVEIVSSNAAHQGAISDITATTTSSITTTDDLSAFASVGDSIRIRKHVTIADVFGATNSAGLLASDDASTADEVIIYDGAQSTTYWYYNGSAGGAAGWYDLSFNLAGGVSIGPSDGIVLKRKAPGNLTITVAGVVKTGNTFFPIRSGLNVLGTASAQGLTLATSGLVNGTAGLKTSDDASTADEVTIYTATSQTNYWYYDGSGGGTAGWYDLSFNPSGSVTIAPGTAFVISRKGAGAFNWPLPAPTNF